MTRSTHPRQPSRGRITELSVEQGGDGGQLELAARDEERELLVLRSYPGHTVRGGDGTGFVQLQPSAGVVLARGKKTTPYGEPGVVAELGLLGLVWQLRHPGGSFVVGDLSREDGAAFGYHVS